MSYLHSGTVQHLTLGQSPRRRSYTWSAFDLAVRVCGDRSQVAGNSVLLAAVSANCPFRSEPRGIESRRYALPSRWERDPLHDFFAAELPTSVVGET